MIDVTKPLELTDGTPATFLRRDTLSGRADLFIVVSLGEEPYGHRYFHPDTGSHVFGHYANLRNVAEAPAFDPTKPVETRDGRKARIICTDRNAPDESIVALIEDQSGYEHVSFYTAAGEYYAGAKNPRDLVNVEPVTVSYVPLGKGYETLLVARGFAINSGEAAVKIEKQGDKVLSAEVVPIAA